MHGNRTSSRPFLRAFLLGVMVSGVVFFILRTFGFPDVYMQEAFLGVVFFCIALVTVMSYQAFKLSESAEQIARGMTNDMLVYSRELFSELYRNSPVPYILIDEAGSITSINFSSARLFHTELNALDGMDVFSFIGGADVHKVSLIPEYYKQGKFINDADVSITRPDGSIRWVMLSLFSTTDQKGLRTGLLTLVDVTKQKQVDTAKTEFVSLASHQLRTPISGMKWNLELLQSGGNDQFTTLQSGYIEKIKHGLERMDLLVTDFLSVSKFELGTLTPTYTSVALEPFLLAVHDELRAFAEQRAVTVFTEWDDTLSSLQSDAHLLHMIVSNLLGNAIKYTMQGGEVRIKAHESEGVFTLTITDTGIGIPLDEQGRVFSKMFRAQNAQVQVSEGTGLGLYIVQEAVQILGGSISFVSTEKVGTTFTVVLPKP